MKHAIVLLFCCWWAGLALGQYTVLHVKGDVILKSTGKAPAVGEELGAKEAVALQSKGAGLSLWASGKGRFLVECVADSFAKCKGTFLPIEKAMKPSKSYAHYPLQAQIRSQEDFQKHFDRPYLLLPGTAVPLDTRDYPLSAEQIIYVRFLHTSLNAEVPTRLIVRNDSLLLDPEQFLNMNGVKVTQQDATDLSIRYTQNRKSHVWICNFQPVYLHPQLYKELDLLSDITRNEKNPELIKQMKNPEEYFNFVCEAWGIPDYDTFLKWAKMKPGSVK